MAWRFMTKETQRQKILRILSDYQAHCLTWEMFCKDDRTRISELRKLGYIFDETLGNCHDPRHNHGAGLKLRRLINNPLGSQIPVKTQNSAPQQAPKPHDLLTCPSYLKFGVGCDICRVVDYAKEGMEGLF